MAVSLSRIVVPTGDVVELAPADDSDRIGFEIVNEGPGGIHIAWNADVPSATVGREVEEGERFIINSPDAAPSFLEAWQEPGGQCRAFALNDHSGAGGQDVLADVVLQVVVTDRL